MSWYVANTGNHQGLVIDEQTCDTIAVAYDKVHAPLIAAAPNGYALAEHLLAMANDAYLLGHPEWAELIAEAQAFIRQAKGQA